MGWNDQTPEDYLGSVKLFAGPFVPRGYRLCDGREYSIKENAAMYSILGNRFGGDGVETFCVPTMESPGKGLYYIICWIGNQYPTREETIQE